MDSSQGPNRPVRQIPDQAQLSLVDADQDHRAPGNDQTDSTVSPSAGRRFIDPDPSRLSVGLMGLEAYLCRNELEWVLRFRQIVRSASFEAFVDRYDSAGRPPYHPAAMMGLIVYGLVRGASSLRELEELARLDAGSWWLSGGICPDHATLGRFIQRHDDQIGGQFFEETTAQILGLMPEPSREISGDGTVVEAVASRYSMLKTEAARELVNQIEEPGGAGEQTGDERAKRQQTQSSSATVEDDDEDEEEDDQGLCRLESVLNKRVEQRRNNGQSVEETRFSQTEPEAVWHRHKDGRYRFGYIVSVVANANRLIVGHDVDPSSETAVVEDLVNQAERVFDSADVDDASSQDQQVGFERLMLDGNYFTLDILKMGCERGIDMLVPAPGQLQEPPDDSDTPYEMLRGVFAKSEFTHDPLTNELICPADERMQPRISGYDKDLDKSYTGYRTQACNQGCVLRDLCTTSPRGRMVKRFDADTIKDAMRQVMEQPRARQAYQSRMGSVEPVFGQLKNQGMDRSKRATTQGVKTEVALHSLGHNFRRLKTKICQAQIGHKSFKAAGLEHRAISARSALCVAQRPARLAQRANLGGFRASFAHRHDFEKITNQVQEVTLRNAC